MAELWKINEDYIYIYVFFPDLYTLQASISKSMGMTNSKRHPVDGRTYHMISNKNPIRDPVGSTIPETGRFLMLQ